MKEDDFLKSSVEFTSAVKHKLLEIKIKKTAEVCPLRSFEHYISEGGKLIKFNWETSYCFAASNKHWRLKYITYIDYQRFKYLINYYVLFINYNYY